MAYTQITKYKVVRYGNSGGPTGAFIHCYDAGGSNVMSCVFWNDEASVPVNKDTGTRVLLYYPTSSFGSILNLLQSEEPMYFNFIASSKTGFLSTSQEPIGEEEGV